MKNAYVAVENHEEVTPEVKRKMDQLAEERHIQIQGIIQYPRGMILENPEAFIEMLKTIKADTVFVTNPEFIIHEIQTDGKLAEMAKEENIHIVDSTLDIDIADMKEVIPDFMMKELKSLIALKNTLDTTIRDKMQKLNEKDCVMIVVKDTASDKLQKLIDDAAKQGYCHLNVIEMSDYTSPMDEMYEVAIREHGIDKIIVADDYDSVEFNEFLKKQEDKGIEVVYEFDEMNISMNRILMN